MQVAVLDATTKKFQAKLSGAAATTNPDYVCAYADDTGTAFTEGSTNGALNGTTAVDIVPAPAAATRRVVKNITIFNRDTAPVTLTVYFNDNGTQRVIFSGVIAVGSTWTTDVTQGLKGDTGATGATGATGSTGATGPAGPANTGFSATDGATVTFDIDTNGGLQSVTLGGNRTLAFTITTNRVFAIILQQDGSGGHSVTWPSGISWAGGTVPTLTTGAGKADIFVLIRTGSGAYMGLIAGLNI